MSAAEALPAAPRTVLRVDLGAVVANWRALRERHGADVAGVVKADGYGLGAAEIGRALRDAGCREFFVAHLDEAMALREAIGPGPEIAVLNGFPPGREARTAGITPVLNGLVDIEQHAAAAREQGRALPAILHVDTGMARLGLPPDELDRLAAEPERLAGLDLRYVMTHLACADEPEHPLNAQQAARFRAACERLPAMRRSFANSSGLFLGPEFRSDLARPGCALYGINPAPGRPNPMRPVIALGAPVLQIRDVSEGETVGYGASWTARRPSRVATVPVGYADGYLRALSGHAEGLIGAWAVPLVGRVSMDLTIFDVTEHPTLRPGDRITLIGGDLTPDRLAGLAGTIGYEVLTSLGARYARDYIPA